jgi:LysM repeat protein
MVARSPARYLAPLALAATIAGTYLIVHSGLKKHSSATTSTQAAGGSRAIRARRKFAKAKFYVVQPGDSLTSIAAKTGISVTTLEALNSNIDPNSLQTAQRLRLRR